MSEDFDPRTAPLAADELQGRIILVTGAGQGIGRAVALRCAQHGATVLLLGRTPRHLEEVHAQITARHGSERAAIIEFDRRMRWRVTTTPCSRPSRNATSGWTACCTTPPYWASWRRSSTTTFRPGAGSCR